MMHVVILSDYAEVNGGAARVAVVSARALADAGVPVTYVCGTGPVSAGLDHPLISVRHLGLPDVWSIPNKAQAVAMSIWNHQAQRGLRDILADVPDDAVVNVHQWSRSLSPSIFAALAGTPW